MSAILDTILGAPETRRATLRSSIAAPIAIASVLVAIAVTVYAALDSTAPILWNDETGYLSNAQILSGVGAPRDLSGRGYYYIGWSFLLVPLWWISTDPQVIYSMAVALSVASSLAAIIPLTLIGRRLGIDTWLSITGAAIVVMAPARTVQSSLALSESFLTLVLALVALFAVRFAAERSAANASLLLFFAVWAFVTHGRMASVLAAAVLWVVISRWRQWISTTILVAVTIAASAGSFVLYRSLAERLYGDDSNRESVGISRIFEADIGAVIVTGSGQLWYLQVAWLGLAVVGLCFIALHAWREWRSRRLDGATWALVAVAGAAVLSVTWLSTRVGDGTARLDMFTYGRYLDPVTTIVAFFGIVWFIRGLSRRQSLVITVVQLVIIGAFALVALVAIPRPLDLNWVPTSVSGLLAYPWPFVTSASGPPWIVASAVGVLSAIALLLLRTRQIVILVVAVIAFGSMSIVAERQTMHPFFAGMYDSFTLRDELGEIEPGTISFDSSGLLDDTVSQNSYQFWVAPDPLPVFDSTTTAPTTEYVIARKDWPAAEALGAELVAEDTGMFNNALWRLP